MGDFRQENDEACEHGLALQELVRALRSRFWQKDGLHCALFILGEDAVSNYCSKGHDLLPKGASVPNQPQNERQNRIGVLFHARTAQLASRPVSTRGMVRNKIFQSSTNDQLSMYCMSSFIQVSKSRLSRPDRAHRQVSPGRMRRRRRCHA